MPTIDSTDGVRLAYHDLGGEGPPMLWCHATGFHGRVYGPLADHIPHRRHWAVDFRGFGDSTEPDGALSWHGFADDVLAVLDDLDPAPRVAFGHSKGGAALLLAELARPGTFDALWLFEPIVFPPVDADELRSEPPLATLARRRKEHFDSYEAAIERYSGRGGLATLDPATLDAYVRHGFAPDPAGGVRLKARPEHEARTYETATEHGAFGRLGSVRCPVTVAASGDGEGPAEIAPLVADALPAGALVRFDDLGHFGPLDAPARVAAAIDEALPR